jgi:hypothetical protein
VAVDGEVPVVDVAGPFEAADLVRESVLADAVQIEIGSPEAGDVAAHGRVGRRLGDHAE